MNEEMYDAVEADAVANHAAGFDTQIRKYVTARIQKEAAEAKFSEAARIFKEAQDELYDFLEAAGTKTINHDLGRFTRTNRTIATVQDPELLAEWIDNHGLRNSLVATKIRQAELNAVVKELIAEGQDPPDGVEPLTLKGVTFSRAKG